MTRAEAEGAFALSLARHDTLSPDDIWDLKAQTLRKQNLLTLHRGREDFASLCGLSALKDFCRRALPPGRSFRVVRSSDGLGGRLAPEDVSSR